MGHFPFYLERPTNSVLSGLTAPSLTSLQNEVDTLVGLFVNQAGDPSTLTSMVTGGLANRLIQSSLAKASLSFSHWAKGGAGYLGEIFTYELTRRGWENGWGNLKFTDLTTGMLHSGLSLGLLKGALRLTGGHNPILSQLLPPVGMAWGQSIASSLGIIPEKTEGLAQTLLSAESAHLQMRAGMALLGEFHPRMTSFAELFKGQKFQAAWRNRLKSLEPPSPRVVFAGKGLETVLRPIFMASDKGDRKTPTGWTGKIQILGQGVDFTIEELAERIRNKPEAILRAFRAAKDDGNSISLRVLAEVAKTNPEAVFALHNLWLARIAGAQKYLTNLEIEGLLKSAQEGGEKQEQALLALHVLAESHNVRALEQLMKFSLKLPKAKQSLDSLSAKDPKIAQIVFQTIELKRLGEEASEGTLRAIFEISRAVQRGDSVAFHLLETLALNPHNPSGGEILSSFYNLTLQGVQGSRKVLQKVAQTYPQHPHGERSRFLLDQLSSLQKAEGPKIRPD